MTTLQELRRNTHKYSYPKGEVGIEIETESKDQFTVPMFNYWTAHGDGSLRNVGVEFVLAKPLEFGSLAYREALEEFNQFASGRKWIESTYTSVHVHLNMVNRNLLHMANFITLYLIFENVLTRYCGPDRDGNLFCLKTSDAEANYEFILALIQNIDSGTGDNYIHRLNANQLKYAGLNIAPLKNFGSIEVRTHGGTTDVEKIDRWISILMCIYRAAEKYSSPVEIVNIFKGKNSYSSTVNNFFGEYAKYLLNSEVDSDINNTLYYAAALAASAKDWKNFGKAEAPRISRRYKVLKDTIVAGTPTLNQIDNQVLWAPAVGIGTMETFAIAEDE